MDEKLLYYLNDEKISIPIIRTKNKLTYLKIRNEKIIVLANRYITNIEIKKFVDKNIERFYKEFSKRKSINLISIEEAYFYLFGIKKQFNILTGFNKTFIEIINKKIYIKIKNNLESNIDKCIQKFLASQLNDFLKNRIKFWGEKMNILHFDYSLRDKRSNWAVNYFTKKKIIFSTRLAHFSHEIIDYVIVHEMAHYKEPNHSLQFWKIVEKYINNYKEVRLKLKNIILI